MNTPMKCLLTGSLLTLAVVATPGAADAQSFAGRSGAHVSRVDFEPHVIAGYGFSRGPGDYGGGFGLGLRVGFPLIANGPVRSINNSLVLSVGADITYWSGRRNQTFWGTSEVIIPLMLQWNFYLAPSFSLFPEAGVALGIGGCDGCAFFAAPGFALGARVHFDARAGYPALVFRIGFPVGFTIGVAF